MSLGGNIIIRMTALPNTVTLEVRASTREFRGVNTVFSFLHNVVPWKTDLNWKLIGMNVRCVFGSVIDDQWVTIAEV